MKTKTYTGHGVLLALAIGLTVPVATAIASDPEPVTIDQLDVNQDEIAQGILPLKAPDAELQARQTAFGQRVAELLADEALQIAAAEAEQAKSTHPAELERRIARIKQETELAILRLQVDRARTAGDEETAQQLETAIEEILNPRIVPVQVERPTPQQPR